MTAATTTIAPAALYPGTAAPLTPIGIILVELGAEGAEKFAEGAAVGPWVIKGRLEVAVLLRLHLVLVTYSVVVKVLQVVLRDEGGVIAAELEVTDVVPLAVGDGLVRVSVVSVAVGVVTVGCVEVCCVAVGSVVVAVM